MVFRVSGSGFRRAQVDAMGMSSNSTTINRNNGLTANCDVSASVRKSEIRARMVLGLGSEGLRIGACDLWFYASETTLGLAFLPHLPELKLIQP